MTEAATVCKECDLAGVKIDQDELRYVIKRNRTDVEEIKKLLEAHSEEVDGIRQEVRVHIKEQKIEIAKIFDKLDPLFDRLDDLAAAGRTVTFISDALKPVKTVILWGVSITAGLYAFSEWIKHLGHKQ